MIAYYPYVIGALLSIYPHSTNQSQFCHSAFLTGERLQQEKPGLLRSLSNAVSISARVDLACKELTPREKQQLCDEAMREAVPLAPYMTGNLNARSIHIDSFVQGANSTLAVPQLANPRDPYTCKKIPVDVIGIEKNMFWCPHRVFRVKETGATDQAEGFFMSGSKTEIDLIFIYKPPQPNSRKVNPWAMLTSVHELKQAAMRCGMHRTAGSSSSSVNPVS